MMFAAMQASMTVLAIAVAVMCVTIMVDIWMKWRR